MRIESLGEGGGTAFPQPAPQKFPLKPHRKLDRTGPGVVFFNNLTYQNINVFYTSSIHTGVTYPVP